jgi:hypothetical protein
MLEVYNFFSELDKEGFNEDTMGNIQSYRRSFSSHREKFNLPTLTGRAQATKPPSPNTGNKRDSDNRGAGSGGGAKEHLEAKGYVVIPDYFEDKGGRMEAFIKVRIVRCRNPSPQAVITL